MLPLALLLRMALNALDGMMARTYNMQSKAGEVLNEIGDVISDLFIFAPIGILFKIDPIILIVFLLLSAVNEFAGILGKAVSGERRYEGPMGKSDRALVIGLVALISFFSEALLPYTNYIFGVILVLLIISTAVRIRKTLTMSA
jgi:CDP-diacylglycerol--glycerol-3-phosphate 3-phosphatidyltransferase